MNALLERKPEQTPSGAPKTKTKPASGSDWSCRWKAFQEWARIHGRRAAHRAHGALSIHRTVGPASFLVIAGALGVALTLTTLYTTSYAVTLDGQEVGVVADRSVVDEAIEAVEAEGSSLLGYDYQVEGDLDYQFALTLKSDITEQREIKEYFYSQLDEASEHLRKYEVLVDGRSMGVVQDEDTLNTMLEELKSQYVNENTTEASFVENLTIDHVYSVDALMTVDEMQAALEESSVGGTTYTVESGDTFNAIAYANDMAVSDLKALNPDVNVNRLMIGQVLNVKERIPVLSIQTKEHQTYTEEIECPVETVEDSKMYEGNSKILTQGTPGEALVEANVTYVNGYEREREVLSSTTLREPTTTVKAVGTAPRPKTASYGTYSWPIKGRITSYFGGRKIFGSYSYHSGIDIAASYGAAIKAADGGTVTFAGYKGTYGKLVIITHDNGTKTYYAHNSSLLVSAGQKVYKGQQIAKAGSTGRSTGVHCHFEMRVNNKAVNPLNYLR